jgi:predicted HTH transcriptional regulator
MSENNRLEYKRQLTENLEKEVVAFLNYLGGGIIYIGFDKDGTAFGIQNSDELQLQIKDRIKNNISPSCLGLFDVIEETLQGKTILKIIIASGQVLDKIDVENKTYTKITSKERVEKKQWKSLALREAVINAMVHNDYTYELAPKFEFFSDRFEITSYGGLPQGLSKDEFFEGISIPRSKELMRVF